ncbi:unnamed protein product [Ranitomeya imitator]|uniref:Chromo domain-containing protein n=1 Tax=Ranitomeya imitator TaxID=111125 RepID=A0ABN9LIL0_9NEOB|nr:unnamed protein product [Ranitomeya imitator]
MAPSVDPPAPVLVEGELEYVVKILDSRISRRKLQYLVKWKGYGQEDNSWVFASDVHAADLVRAFHLAHHNRPGGSGEGSVTPPQGGGTVVNSVIELPPVVMNGTSASSVHGLPLVAVSEAAASEVPSTDCYHDFALLAGSSGMQSGTSAPPVPSFYKYVLAFMFAIDEINKNPYILPNVTLGYHVTDSCNNEYKAIENLLQILSGPGDIVPNYSCLSNGKLVGVVGDQSSKTSIQIIEHLNVYGYTQYRNSDTEFRYFCDIGNRYRDED